MFISDKSPYLGFVT